MNAGVKPVVVVLDDDPTGIQTVKNVEIFMEWGYPSLIRPYGELDGFFILTNSRAMAGGESARVHREIARVLCRCMKETGRRLLICSRSDSTLRGHYPIETDALASVMADNGIAPDKLILCPCFVEGGRVTRGGIHFVRNGENYVPAAETEFAKDPYFGYRNSDLAAYVEEKTTGRIRREDVARITLAEIRAGKSLELLKRPSAVAVCDGEDYADMDALAGGIFAYCAEGNNPIVRCAASVVRSLFGGRDEALLPASSLVNARGKGGLIIAGSYTQRTTEQLNRLRALDADWIELDVSDDLFAQTEECVSRCEAAMGKGRLAVLYTSRAPLSASGGEESLRASLEISKTLCDIVSRLKINPRYIIAKGGITCYDIGVKALASRRATAAGQAVKGVPVWSGTGRFPQTPFIIFPGNVGDAASLFDLVIRLNNG